MFCFQRHRRHYCGSQLRSAKDVSKLCWKQKNLPATCNPIFTLQTRLFLFSINKMLSCFSWKYASANHRYASFICVCFICTSIPLPEGLAGLWHDFKQLTHWAILVTTGTSCSCWMEKSGHFGYYERQTGNASSLFGATKTCGRFPVMFAPTKPGVLSPYSTLIKWFLHLNPSRPWTQRDCNINS